MKKKHKTSMGSSLGKLHRIKIVIKTWEKQVRDGCNMPNARLLQIKNILEDD